MNKNQISAAQVAQQNTNEAPTESAIIAARKKYVRPVLSEPEGLLETTKFFFQSAEAGSLSHQRPPQNDN